MVKGVIKIMKNKKWFIIIVICIVIAIGFFVFRAKLFETYNSKAEPDNSNPQMNIIEQTSVAGKFFLSQTPEEFLTALEQEGIKLYPSENESPHDIDLPNGSVKDGRTYNADGSFYFSSDDIHAAYSADGILVSLIVRSPKYSTDKGLRVGDTKEKMVNIYGVGYTTDEYLFNFYHYPSKNGYLIVEVVDDVVVSWRLSIYEMNLGT